MIMALNPTTSNKVSYSVRCAPAVRLDPNLVKPIQPGPGIQLQKAPALPPPSGGGAGPIVHLADLVPEFLDPFAFRVAVRNIGDAAAGPSAVLLKCRATSGGAGSKGACPSDPSFAPLFDASLGGFVVAVPAIPAGGARLVPMPPHGPWRGLPAPTSSWRSPTSVIRSPSGARRTTRRRGRSRAEFSAKSNEAHKRQGPGPFGPGPSNYPGSVLLSHTVSRAVPSAPRGLTAVFGMGTGGAPSIRPPETLFRNSCFRACRIERSALANASYVAPQEFYGQAARTISTGQLRASQRFHTRPINVVISHGPSGGLRPGEISSWGRLHAYMPSAFIQTELRYPACAAGATTGAQEVRPTRSSRTRVGAPQISCAHTR